MRCLRSLAFRCVGSAVGDFFSVIGVDFIIMILKIVLSVVFACLFAFQSGKTTIMKICILHNKLKMKVRVQSLML